MWDWHWPHTRCEFQTPYNHSFKYYWKQLIIDKIWKQRHLVIFVQRCKRQIDSFCGKVFSQQHNLSLQPRWSFCSGGNGGTPGSISSLNSCTVFGIEDSNISLSAAWFILHSTNKPTTSDNEVSIDTKMLPLQPAKGDRSSYIAAQKQKMQWRKYRQTPKQ